MRKECAKLTVHIQSGGVCGHPGGVVGRASKESSVSSGDVTDIDEAHQRSFLAAEATDPGPAGAKCTNVSNKSETKEAFNRNCFCLQ